jgi:hypothetical protein
MGDATLPLLLVQLILIVAGLRLVPVLPTWAPLPLLPPVSVLLLSAAVAAFVFWMSEPLPETPVLFTDFRRAYYPAGQAVLEGPQALTPLIERGVHGFVNLPIVAYLFAPFGALPVKWAARLYFVMGLGATLIAWALLARAANLDGRERSTLFFLFAVNGPLINSFKEGNTSHILLLPVVAAFLLLRGNRQVLAGVLLGLCALIKLPFLIFAPYLVLRRYWQAAAGMALVVGGGGLLSVALFGWELNQRWFELCVVPFSSNPIAAFNVQSIPGFLARLWTGPDLLYTWMPLPAEPLQRMIGSALSALLLLAAVLACLRRPQERNGASSAEPQAWRALEYGIVVTLAVIASPLSWSHYYCWLLFPIAFFLRRDFPLAPEGLSRVLGWAALVLVSQAVVFLKVSDPVLAGLYAKVMVSSMLLGGLLWFGLLVVARARLTAGAVAAKDLQRAY